MKTDWSQMNGEWVTRGDREPNYPGQYFITTNRLRELPCTYDGSEWGRKDLRYDEWPVFWFEAAYSGKTEPLLLTMEDAQKPL